MSDPRDKDDRQTGDFARLPGLLKEWQGVVAVLGGAVTAVLSVLFRGQTPAVAQVIGYGIAVLMLGGGAFIFVRVRRRRQARRIRERQRETAGEHMTAFRGLLPYQEGDDLPGEHRRLEARRLVTQFSEPTFSFGVVCGDSGCGKTSLLRSAIQRRLKAVGEERGFGVLYLSNPRELADDGARDDAARRLRGELDRLGQLAAAAAEGRPLILIIDQFEEFFIEYGRPELRLELGRFLDGLIKSNPSVRILCALRRDYLADMKDLAPPRPDAGGNFFEPISLQGLFTLKNFTVEQAARVIKECAERDGLDVDDEFARTLASDLGEGDSVRPPELQIVCTALGGNPTLAEYRLAGGARGILSHYIEDAVGVSGDPNTGRRVLRALCDFPAHAKRNPQAVAAIAEAVGVEGAQSSALIRTALRQFERARLAVSERRGDDEPGYALVHDYLVDAVAKATGDVSTRDEEANQLLEYYVAEYRADPKTRIPYRRLRFVRKYADRKQLADPTARRLLRASLTRLVTAAAALAALVAVATTLLVAFTTTSRVWHQEVVGNYWEGSNIEEVHWVVQEKRGLLIVGINEAGRGEKNAKLWNVATASQASSFKGEELRYIPPDYILGYSKTEPTATAFHIPTGRELRSVIPTHIDRRSVNSGDVDITVSETGTTVALRQNVADFLRQYKGRQPPTVSVFSLAQNKPVGEMESCFAFSYRDFYVTDDGEHFLIPCYEEEIFRPTVFNVRAKEKRVLAREGYGPAGEYAFDARNSRVASLESSGDGRAYLILWDVRTGEHLDQIEVRLNGHGGSASFTPDGEFIIVAELATDNSYMLYRTKGLRRVLTLPEEGVRFIRTRNPADDTNRDYHVMFAWPNASGGTYLWDLAEAEPKLMPELTLAENPNLVPDVSLGDAGVRAIHTDQKKTQVELWDFKAGKKLRTLDIPGRFYYVEFTIGGNAVSVSVEGGTVSLFRAADGEKITDDIRNLGGSEHAIYYDEKCRRLHVWTDEGRVLRYTEGWHLFGRESWFWPAEKCATQ